MAGPGKTGPEKIEISIADLADLPRWALSMGAVARHLGVGEKTLERRRAESVELDQAIKARIRQQKSKAQDHTTKLLMERMDSDDPHAMTALIWFDKSRLGFSERVTNIQEGEITLKTNRRTIPLPEAPEEADAASSDT